jgi:hypothetical protein
MSSDPARRAVLTCLALSFLAGCGGDRASVTGPATRAEGPVIEYAGLDRRTVNEVPAESMRFALKRQFELRPDARFLLALADIHHVASGAPYDTLRAELRYGTWTITYAGSAVGALPRLASFRDADSLLLGWARQVLATHPLAGAPPAPQEMLGIEKLLAQFSAPRTAKALQQLDSAWRAGGGSAALLEPAARGLASLVVQVNDENERADRLAAHALALDVLARAASGSAAGGGTAILAAWLGYAVDARSIAATLDTASAIRQYVEGSLPSLRAAAAVKNAPPLTRYLFLLRSARAHDSAGWKEYARGLPADILRTPAFLGAALLTNDFDLQRRLPRSMPDALLDELDEVAGADSYWRHFWRDNFEWLDNWGGPSAWGGSTGRKAAEVQRRAAALGTSFAGPLLDAASYRAYYDAQLATAIAASADFLVHRFGDAALAADFGRELQRSRYDEATRMQGRAIELLAMTNPSTPAIDSVVTLLGEPWDGGAPIRYELTDHATTGIAMNSGPYMAAIFALGTSLDSRVRQRIDLAWLAQYKIVDLNLADELYASAVAAVGDDEPQLVLQQARVSGNDREVLRLATDTTVPRWVRSEAVEKLAHRGVLAGASLDAAYERLVTGAPAKDDAWGNWLEYLEKASRLKEAEAVARRRVAAAGAESVGFGDAGFGRIYAATTLAHVLQLEGRPADAWTVIAPVIPSYQGGAMVRGALILADLERIDSAAALAGRALRRYPGLPHARAALAEIYWRADRPADAAAVLSPEAFPYGAGTWTDEFGEAYVNAFAGKPLTDAEGAVSAMVARRVRPHQAKGIAIYADAHGRHDLAYTAQVVLAKAATVPTQRVQLLLPAYDYLASWKGDSAANAWYRASMPKLDAAFTADYLFTYLPERTYLLWNVDPSRSKDETEVWLRRTSAELLASSGAPPHRAELVAHYAARDSDRYDRMARVLLGIDPADAILPLASDPHGRAEVSYYFAVKALHEGRYDEAADWFAVCVGTGSARDSEWYWSQGQLRAWTQAETNPSALMARASHTP